MVEYEFDYRKNAKTNSLSRQLKQSTGHLVKQNNQLFSLNFLYKLKRFPIFSVKAARKWGHDWSKIHKNDFDKETDFDKNSFPLQTLTQELKPEALEIYEKNTKKNSENSIFFGKKIVVRQSRNTEKKLIAAFDRATSGQQNRGAMPYM